MIERLYYRAKRNLPALLSSAAPWTRRFVRLLALPYCYFRLVNWNECTVSRWRVASDLIYIFFILKYFPDNYGACRLWRVPRSSWPYYYGSSYNPWPRAQLRREVQRKEYEILFEDKEVCHMLCLAAGLPVPSLMTTMDAGDDWSVLVEESMRAASATEAVIKPTRGSAGRGIFSVRIVNGVPMTLLGGKLLQLEAIQDRERSIVQSRVHQVDPISDFHEESLNTVRVLTLLTKDSDVVLLGGSMRFGVGGAPMDNWSAGGVAAGVNPGTGELSSVAWDKSGREYEKHPSSGRRFGSFTVPNWMQVADLARSAQRSFPFYRLLGFDIAVTPSGPVLIEVNAFPDLVFQEQTSGPLLRDKDVLREFGRWGLLINSQQHALLATASPGSPRVE